MNPIAPYATAVATVKKVPLVDQYGTKITEVAVPKSCKILAHMGYAVGRIRADGVTWFNLYLDGDEVVDGFSNAPDAWDAAGRHDDTNW